MLEELAVSDLGVISSLTIPLGGGMTALTGETGAGKTMIVEAIGLLLGARSDPDRVRTGATEAVVEGRFIVDDVEHVLRRVIPVEGRSRAYIDGRLATATELAELGTRCVEVHGQHSQQTLMGRAAQREALDRYGRVDLGAWGAARGTVEDLRAERAALGGDERARARELDLIAHQLQELDAAGLEDPGEDERLREDEELLGDALGHLEVLAAAGAAIHDDGAAVDLIRSAAALLARRPALAASASRLVGVAAELDDVAEELRALAAGIEDDPERLAEVQQRRALLSSLRRKYGETIADVISERETLRAEHTRLLHAEERALLLDAEMEAAARACEVEARAVGDARRGAASSLGDAVTRRLRPLGMSGAVVEVAVGGADEGDPAGEVVDFLIGADPEAQRRPLAKVASGGELSRTMLALHLALSAGPPTMIFDEVDAGIGGATATDVGRALRRLAADRQVIVVTHLPQVAAFADHQLAVTKSRRGGLTTSSVVVLDADSRVVELSRMMTGSPESGAARRHAEELLDAAGAERAR